MIIIKLLSKLQTNGLTNTNYKILTIASTANLNCISHIFSIILKYYTLKHPFKQSH